MDHCANCKNWLIQRVTDYEDGSRIINFQTPDGKGLCGYLQMETSAEFGCNQFGEGHQHVEIMDKKRGSPWMHSHWGPCPDCKASPNGPGWGCKRCAGSAKVLYYDDGYIGEEQTRKHPNEIAAGKPPDKPTCPGCGREVDFDWVACPRCGARTNKPDEPVIVEPGRFVEGQII